MAADHARRIDPTLGARYQRLMVEKGKHQNSALCNVATTLLTRIVACWRAGEPYVIRDTDGRPVSVAEGRQIVAARFTVPTSLRELRRSTAHAQPRMHGTSRRRKESLSAPSTGSSPDNAKAATTLDTG